MGYYKEYFRSNPETKRIVIEVSLDNYLDFYHEWDNAKYKKRDINPELVIFLEDCSEQINLKESVEIRFNIEDGEKNENSENQIRESFKNYYHFTVCSIKGMLRRIYKVAVASIMISIAMLLFVYFAEEHLSEGILSYTLINGFEIGGWVFMWQAFYGIGFERIEEKTKIKQFKRLLSADITFTYYSNTAH